MPISSFYYYIQVGQIIPSIPSHSWVSRRHQLLSPNLLPLFNSSSPVTAQKPLPPIRHICGLGASVGCERIERTFNTPRLKSQICLIGGNGFVCSSLNELNSNNLSLFQMGLKDTLTNIVLLWLFRKQLFSLLLLQYPHQSQISLRGRRRTEAFLYLIFERFRQI